MPIDFPNSPSNGSTHTVNGVTWEYDGTAWNVASGGAGLRVSATAPTSPATGDLWYDSESGKVFIYYDSQWVSPAVVASVPTASAGTITGSNGEGTASTFARSDHNHDLSITPSWTTVTFNTGWGNYNIAWETAAYYKDRFGFAHLRGMVSRSSGTETTIFTLPSGSRPPLDITFPIIGSAGTGRLTISSSSGNVLYESGGTTWYSLNGVYFRT